MLFKFKTWNQIQEIKKMVIEDITSSKIVGISPIIDYAKFLILYKPYKDIISEKEFASILEVNYSAMIKGTRVKILKSMKNEIDELIKKNEKILKQEIIEDVVYSGRIGISPFIKYQKFLEFYLPYEDILTEEEFGRLLEVRIEYMREGKRSKILNSIKDDIIEQNKKCGKTIATELIKDGKVKPGQRITYKHFLKIYEPYKDIASEREFATLLEINYDYMRHSQYTFVILASYINMEGIQNESQKERGVRTLEHTNEL